MIDQTGGLKQFLIISERTIKLVGVDDRSKINEICTSRTRTLCPKQSLDENQGALEFQKSEAEHQCPRTQSRSWSLLHTSTAAPCCRALMPNLAPRRTKRNDAACRSTCLDPCG